MVSLGLTPPKYRFFGCTERREKWPSGAMVDTFDVFCEKGLYWWVSGREKKEDALVGGVGGGRESMDDP